MLIRVISFSISITGRCVDILITRFKTFGLSVEFNGGVTLANDML
jgi:hypothetical protein